MISETLAASLSTILRPIFNFSAETYTTIGLGDIYPLGPLRLITGIEALNGLLLIGWSASFTYLAMQKFWDIRERD